MKEISGGSFERKVKRFVLGVPHAARMIPGPGFIEAVENELSALLPALRVPSRFIPRPKRDRGTVLLENIGFRSLCELTFRLLSPADVRLVLSESKVTGREGFVRALEKTPFEYFVPRGSTFSVRSDSVGSRLYHEGLIEELASEYLVKNGRIPSADAGFRLFLVLFENVLSVELSLAGDPLWKRGYREELKAAAPLREDLAQCAVRISAAFHVGREAPADFHTLIVPFSGTGTFLFEALMNRWELTPRMFGRTFAFELFPSAPVESIAWIMEKISAASRERMSADAEGAFRGAVLLDNDAGALAVSKLNADRFFSRLGNTAGNAVKDFAASDLAFRNAVRFLNDDAFSLDWRGLLPENPGTVFLPLNPPYGKRLHGTGGDFKAVAGKVFALAESVTGRGGTLFGFVLCPDESAWKDFLSACGPCAHKTVHFSQGGLDIRLVAFSFA